MPLDSALEDLNLIDLNLGNVPCYWQGFSLMMKVSVYDRKVYGENNVLSVAQKLENS